MRLLVTHGGAAWESLGMMQGSLDTGPMLNALRLKEMVRSPHSLILGCSPVRYTRLSCRADEMGDATQPKNLPVSPSVPPDAVRVRTGQDAARATSSILHDPALRELACKPFTAKQRTRLSDLDLPQSNFYSRPLPGYDHSFGDHRR
jgi:hypothetical protein